MLNIFLAFYHNIAKNVAIRVSPRPIIIAGYIIHVSKTLQEQGDILRSMRPPIMLFFKQIIFSKFVPGGCFYGFS